MRRAFSACSLLLFAVSMAAPAQAQGKRLVSVPVWVDGSKCAEAPKFEPVINGTPAPIDAQLTPSSSQIILVVLDLTGNLSRTDSAKQALIDGIPKLPKNVWVGLLQAQDGLHVLVDPTPNRQKVVEAIRSLSINGDPGLLETVRSALSLADAMIRKSPLRVSVYYITDGSIYGYREDYTDPVINPSDPHDLSRRFPEVLIDEKITRLVGAISSLQAPFFVVHLNYRKNRLDLAYQNGLDNLARTTGGEAVFCHSLAEIPAAISNLFARIEAGWRLILSVPPKTHSHLEFGMRALCGDRELQLSWRARFHLKGK